MLVLTTAQMLRVRVQCDPAHMIRPRLLADGNLGVSEQVLVDPAHLRVRSALEEGTVTASPGAFSARPWEELGTIDGKTIVLYADDKKWSLQPTATGHRFELRQGDVGLSTDTGNQRDEISAPYNTVAGGVDVWQSWTTEISESAGFEAILHPSLQNFGFVSQWHGLDTVATGGRSPVLAFDYGNNAFRIVTRSDTDGPSVEKVRFSDVLPIGPVSYVCRLVLGQAGELQVWRNGAEIVSFAGPIGYYNDGTDLAYLQWGIYRRASELPAAVTTSNMRWGLTDLSDKILNPDPM
jgi:hypothetical protein